MSKHVEREILPSRVRRQGAHVGDMQRRRLLRATGELLAEDGIEAASAGSISRRAGVSRRTFYEQFEDREACILATLEEAIERLSEDVAAACGRELGWSARIRAGMIALLEHFEEEPVTARMCVVEALRGGPKVLKLRGRVLRSLTAVVDEGRLASKRSGGPLPLAAEGVVGGALTIVYARLQENCDRSLLELANPLTGMILQPYLGAAAARRELDRPSPRRNGVAVGSSQDPFKGLSIRFTYRTARVLATIADAPGASNRLIADSSGVADEGQMSRLLRRLEQAGLIENRGEGHVRGEPNAWWLTPRGEAVHTTLAGVGNRAA